jgi:PEP-CTERM motif-containing protein
MRKLALLAAAAFAATGLASNADATVTLNAGDNSLTEQVHLDTNADNSNVLTVTGITDSGLQVLFTGNTNIDGTSGSGYAQINDAAGGDAFNTLTITPGNFLGYTGYEFSIMYDGSRNNPIYLTIAYTLVGGGGGSFVFDPLAPNNSPFNNLRYTNNANVDFRLAADGGDIINSIILSGRFGTGPNDPLAPIVQEKQNDVNGVIDAVPEPGTWAMMLLGFGAAGIAIRRTRKKAVAVQFA